MGVVEMLISEDEGWDEYGYVWMNGNEGE